jgi:hypothetical protein
LFKRHRFLSREERRRILYAIVRYYNHLRPHQSLDGKTPFQALEDYIQGTKVEFRELSKSVTNAWLLYIATRIWVLVKRFSLF